MLEEFGVSDQFYHELSMILYYNIWDKQMKKVKTEVMR